MKERLKLVLLCYEFYSFLHVVDIFLSSCGIIYSKIYSMLLHHICLLFLLDKCRHPFVVCIKLRFIFNTNSI